VFSIPKSSCEAPTKTAKQIAYVDNLQPLHRRNSGRCSAAGGKGRKCTFALGGKGRKCTFALGGKGRKCTFALGGKGRKCPFALGGKGRKCTFPQGGSGEVALLGGSG
jgi:hypothetical protein